LAPLPVCEIALVSFALFVMFVVELVGDCIGVPVPFAVTLAQEVS
jgi:hypothetical protein